MISNVHSVLKILPGYPYFLFNLRQHFHGVILYEFLRYSRVSVQYMQQDPKKKFHPGVSRDNTDVQRRERARRPHLCPYILKNRNNPQISLLFCRGDSSWSSRNPAK